MLHQTMKDKPDALKSVLNTNPPGRKREPPQMSSPHDICAACGHGGHQFTQCPTLLTKQRQMQHRPGARQQASSAGTFISANAYQAQEQPPTEPAQLEIQELGEELQYGFLSQPVTSSSTLSSLVSTLPVFPRAMQLLIPQHIKYCRDEYGLVVRVYDNIEDLYAESPAYLSYESLNGLPPSYGIVRSSHPEQRPGWRADEIVPPLAP